MFKYLNKGISTPIAIAIILLLAVSVGGITLWRYSEIQEENSELREVQDMREEKIDEDVPKIKNEGTIPIELENLLIEEMIVDYGHLITGVSLDMGTIESVDLNNDGEKEFIIFPDAIFTAPPFTDSYIPIYIRGSHGLGPIYIFQKINGLWVRIGSMDGQGLVVEKEKKGGYHNIYILDDPLSHVYQWQKSRLVYEKIELIKKEENIGWKIYKNEEYGFEFRYPENYYPPSNIFEWCGESICDGYGSEAYEHCKNLDVVIMNSEKGANIVVSVLEKYKNPETSLEEFIGDLFNDEGGVFLHCFIGGQRGNSYYQGLTEAKALVNVNKVEGYEIYMNEVHEPISAGVRSVYEIKRGPIFAFDVSLQNSTENNKKSIVFLQVFDDRMRYKESFATEKENLLDQILSTFRFLD